MAASDLQRYILWKELLTGPILTSLVSAGIWDLAKKIVKSQFAGSLWRKFSRKNDRSL